MYDLHLLRGLHNLLNSVIENVLGGGELDKVTDGGIVGSNQVAPLTRKRN